MRTKGYLYSLIIFIISVLSLITDWYSYLTIILFAVSIIAMLDKLGKGIVLRETIALYTCFICLLMPLIGYIYFPKTNPLSRIWVKYMFVPESVYFNYSLPAISLFILALCWPINSSMGSDNGRFLNLTIEKAKEKLRTIPSAGVYLLVIGTLMFWGSTFMPESLHFAVLLFYFAAFAGILYIYYLKTLRFRVPILIIFSVLILLDALNSGMFTVVAYMGLTIFSFFFMGQKTRLWKKLIWFLLGSFLMIVLQTTKSSYRQYTWKENYQGNRTVLFTDLMITSASSLEWQSINNFFSIYTRTNQGFNVALVMHRIPRVQNYDNGSRLFLTIGSSFVPRFLWPDKPEAGGRVNMQYYAGVKIEGWSTNVGPLGEAYGSFGVAGGIIFMFCLGVIIRWAYSLVFRLAQKTPLIIFWLPVLFYQVTYSAENDTLQIFNSIIKSTFFVYLLYKIVPSLFLGSKRSKRKFESGAINLLKPIEKRTLQS